MKFLILYFRLRSDYLILKHKLEVAYLEFKFELIKRYNIKL